MMAALRGSILVFSTFAIVLGVALVRRSRWAQRLYIKRRIGEPESSMGPTGGTVRLERPEKLAFLRSILRLPPFGPIIMTGPEGAGKSDLLAELVRDRKNTLLVDLRQVPVADGKGLLHAIKERVGWLSAPDEFLSTTIFMTRSTTAQEEKEAQRALELVADVCKQLAQTGGPVPLVVIDELKLGVLQGSGHHSHPLGARFAGADPTAAHILDWILFLTQHKLANVVLSVPIDTAEWLDEYPGMGVRRRRIYVDYPRPMSVKRFLSGPVNDHLSARRWEAQEAAFAASQAAGAAGAAGAAPSPVPARLPRELEDWEIERITETLGGNMQDIGTLVSAIADGEGWTFVVDRMLADSIETVEKAMEAVLQPEKDPLHVDSEGTHGHSWPGGSYDLALRKAAPDDEEAFMHFAPLPEPVLRRYERFLRLWQLLELLGGRKYVPRRDVVAKIYPGHPSELDAYAATGLINITNLRGATKRHTPKANQGSDAVEAATREPEGALPAVTPGAGPGSVAAVAAATSADRAGHHATDHHGAPAAAEGASDAAEKPSKTTAPRAFEIGLAEGVAAHVGAGRYVSATTPRLRLAFRIITASHTMRWHRDRVFRAVRCTELKGSEATLRAQLSELQSERKVLSGRIDARITHLRTLAIARDADQELGAEAMALLWSGASQPSGQQGAEVEADCWAEGSCWVSEVSRLRAELSRLDGRARITAGQLGRVREEMLLLSQANAEEEGGGAGRGLEDA